MGDLISRQAAIVALDNRMQSLENVDMQIAMGFAKGIIYDLQSVTPAEKVREWIPVSERLPEKDELYLVYFDDGEYNLAYFSNGAFSYSGVIAWMPLPEPYKAESEVNNG